MSQLLPSLLIDGALLRGHPLMAALRDSQAGLSLYGDLGEEAQSVGPWLWPGQRLADVAVPELPARHGISEIHAAPAIDLRAHFSRIRYIETHDAQRYFLRYADMRSLSAVRASIDDAQWQFLVGPVQRWVCVDRQGNEKAFVEAPLPQAHRRPENLRLSAKQLARLLEAGLADQLCLAVEELQEEALHPETDSVQFASVEAAARLVAQEGIESFALQRAIARQAVLCGANAIQSAGFVEAVRQARLTGDTERVATWAAR